MEIIPKPAPKRIISPRGLFVVSLLLFFGVVFIFLAFKYAQSNTKKEVQRLDATLNAEKTPQEQQLEQEVLTDQKKIKDFRSLFLHRKDVVLFLQLLESTTLKNVSFNDVKLDAVANTMKLKGEAPDFNSVDQQVTILKQRPEVKDIQLSDIALGEKGGVVFGLDVTFSPQLFK